MRIVGGTHRGRMLAAPRNHAVRPTSDKVREAMFNILMHSVAELEVDGSYVLDLFAGTGALGLEALSRGAAFCVFVESAAPSRALIQENTTNLGFGGATRIFRRDATKLGPFMQAHPFNLVFVDPPYGKGLAIRALTSAIEGEWLANHALVVLEEHAAEDVELPAAMTRMDHRVYGETQIIVAQYTFGLS